MRKCKITVKIDNSNIIKEYSIPYGLFDIIEEIIKEAMKISKDVELKERIDV